MKDELEKIFIIKDMVWPPFLPILAVIFSIAFCSKWPIFICAFVSILFYSLFAFEIHHINTGKISDSNKNEMEKWKKLEDNKWYIYNQYWLNGLGIFVGWIALYILLFYVIKIDHNPLSISIWIWVKHFGIKDLVLVVLSFLGLTGYLPYYGLLGRGSENR